MVLLHKDLLGGAADDRLAFWSDAYEETGVRAYKLVQLGVGWTGETGLYRWVLPRAMPEEVNWDMLDPSEGVLLLPAADFFRVELLDPEDGEWSDEYSGRRPRGIRIMVKSKEEEFPYEDWLPPM